MIGFFALFSLHTVINTKYESSKHIYLYLNCILYYGYLLWFLNIHFVKDLTKLKLRGKCCARHFVYTVFVGFYMRSSCTCIMLLKYIYSAGIFTCVGHFLSYRLLCPKTGTARYPQQAGLFMLCLNNHCTVLPC